MSLISLEKYLYGARKRSEVGRANSDVSHLELASSLMTSIRRSVLVGEAFADLSEDLEGLRKSLLLESEAITSAQTIRLDLLLGEFQTRVQTVERERAHDFKKFCDVLNETFAQLSNGNEKSSTRLKQLETGLNRASQADDLATLRLQLGKLLEYVRYESARDNDEGTAAMESLSNQVKEAHRASLRLRVKMPSRQEAIEMMELELSKPETAGRLHLALLAADSLRAVRARHGDEIVGGFLEELSCEGIRSVTLEAAGFCWSPTSVLLLWQQQASMPPPVELQHKLKNPLECKAFVGTRVAVFKIPIRTLVMAASRSIEEIKGELDSFSRTVAPR